MRAVKDALAGGRTNKKVYKTKEEIQVVKLMEELGRDKLKQMSIIDVEDMFYERYALIESVVKKHEEEIKSETLALEVKYNESRDTYTDTNINGEHINIDVEVIK